MADLSVYRIAGLAIDVKAALRQRGHHVTDEAALSIVHAWSDSNAGPTAVAVAMRHAGVTATAARDAVWDVLLDSSITPPTCRCGHSRTAHEDNGRCRHSNPKACSCRAWTDPATGGET